MRLRLRGLLVFAIAATFANAGCVHTWGAPEGDDYEVESNAEAMEEEEDEDAWGDANR
jgi:hypothetical protein